MFISKFVVSIFNSEFIVMMSYVETSGFSNRGEKHSEYLCSDFLTRKLLRTGGGSARQLNWGFREAAQGGYMLQYIPNSGNLDSFGANWDLNMTQKVTQA